MVAIGSVNSNDGSYHVFDEHHQPVEERPATVLASASVPFIFPHTMLANGTMTMMDGGTVFNTNLVTAADRCLEIVDDDSQIIMDIMLCDYIGHLDKFTDTGSTYDNFMRSWAIEGYFGKIDDIAEFMRTRPNVQYRFMATASKPLASGMQELEIDPKIIEPMIELGFADGKDIIAKGPGYYFDLVLEYAE